jgi:STE24 endopeptidase
LDPLLTPAELAEVQAYYGPIYAVVGARMVLDLVFAALILRFVVRPTWGVATRWANALGTDRARNAPGIRVLVQVLDKLWKGQGWGAALLFALLCLALETAIDLPATIYMGYFHEHAFGLSNYTAGKYAGDLLKAVGIDILARCMLAFGLFALVRRLKAWWLILGVAGTAVLMISAALDPYRARVYFDQTPLPAGELREQITALMKQAGVDFQDVLVEKTSKASKKVNAYFAGSGPTRTIVLGDTLLKEMSTDEVLAVIAHEAGHTHESPWPGRIASGVAFLAFLFFVDRLLRFTHRKGWFGVTEVADIRALPLIFTAFAVIQICISPFTGYFSREREREADRFALALTRNPEAFQRMLKVARRVNKADPDPPLWAVLRGKSHPTYRERFEAAGGPKRLSESPAPVAPPPSAPAGQP